MGLAESCWSKLHHHCFHAMLSLCRVQEHVRGLTSLLWTIAAANLEAVPWPSLLHRPPS